MKILSIETSCDETSVAVVEKRKNETKIRILSQSTATSLPEHAKIGGIIPEKAARRQLEYMLPVVENALGKISNNTPSEVVKHEIDAIAVTYGPGLIGSLLVGVECAKTLSYIFDKPLIPVNHLLAHIYANFIGNKSKFKNQNSKIQTKNLKTNEIKFPFIGLIVSGGHTDLLLFKNHKQYTWLGGTRDDAVGEALDKIGRRLGLSYPGGPEIEKRAKKVDGASVKFKSPLLYSDDFDFSYSGLKTEVVRYIDKVQVKSESEINEICYATQKSAFDTLVKKTVRAAVVKNAKSILIGGGVAANETLKEMLQSEIKKQNIPVNLFFPEKKYTIDNAAMIGAWAAFHPEYVSRQQLKATPEIYFA